MCLPGIMLRKLAAEPESLQVSSSEFSTCSTQQKIGDDEVIVYFKCITLYHAWTGVTS